jgi:hypothetical protein
MEPVTVDQEFVFFAKEIDRIKTSAKLHQFREKIVQL